VILTHNAHLTVGPTLSASWSGRAWHWSCVECGVCSVQQE
jgi:hypothetical protein